MDILLPCSYDIKIRTVDNDWELDYSESFNDDPLLEQRIETTLSILSCRPELKCYWEPATRTFKVGIRGRHIIINFITGEFFGQSALANMTMLELFFSAVPQNKQLSVNLH